ncbi:hypothetical protein BD779DRAFT_1435862 [Infundibulicybe gibba]|nr:hypothetical protein BD779DRAFT_1435862 [Infundibulicybe gibba]
MAHPPLVGGFAVHADFAPSILFAALYLCLIPIYIYRLAKKQSRNTVILGTFGFIIERIVSLSLRAVISRQAPAEHGDGLLEYIQATFAMGFVAIAQDLSHLLRATLVASTHGEEMPTNPKQELVSTLRTWDWIPQKNTSFDSVDTESKSSPCDRPRARSWFRRMHDGMCFFFLVTLVLGFLGNCRIIAQRDNPQRVHENQALRYTSTSLALILLILTSTVSLWAYKNTPRINRKALKYLTMLPMLLAVPAIYRLVVMAQSTSSYESHEPGSQNSMADKSAFYIFHILPEWLASLALCSINVRDVFQTGPWGDTRWRDETPDERANRLQKESEKNRLKAEANVP